METEKLLLEKIRETVEVKILKHDFEKGISELVNLVVKEKFSILIEKLKQDYEASLTMGGTSDTDHVLIPFDELDKLFANCVTSEVKE